MRTPPFLAQNHFFTRGIKKSGGRAVLKTVPAHKPTYLYFATTRLHRTSPLNDTRMMRFGDIGHRQCRNKPLAFETHVAGIWQLLSCSTTNKKIRIWGNQLFLRHAATGRRKKHQKQPPKSKKAHSRFPKKRLRRQEWYNKKTRPRQLAYLPTGSPSPSVFLDAPWYTH